ncbi:MAG: sigma-70 family RNA polymerase sigma factor [Chitinophagaceae bacterium]|nr:sigma-70 family RNA polymerase sigma factor [Chitinophagaceae bacterium]
MQTVPSDQEVIAQVLKGNQQKYELLVNKYQSFAFTIALRYTKNREDAEELAQSAFVKAYLNLKDYRGDAKFSTWLYTIVSSLCLSFLRKKKLDIHSLNQEGVFERANANESNLKADVIEQHSRTGLLNRALQLLNPDDAKVLTLFYKAEQSLEEIAQILHTEPNNAKVKLHRARQRLKETMEKHFAREVQEIF